MSKNPIAVLVSDIHLSDKPPAFRSTEPDWFAAMARALSQLYRVSWKYDIPIVCAGDVFDRWNSSARLINFAIEHLPKMYSICGQHDLPYHSYNQIKSSAYWTLCRAGIITNIEENQPLELSNGLTLHGFGWNTEIAPHAVSDLQLHLAVIHKYIWTTIDTSYVGAPKLNHITKLSQKLKGYHAAVFGDNHKGFLSKTKDGVTVLNNGGFMRRSKDQLDYKPTLGILYSDGSIKRQELDCSEDKTLITENKIQIKDEMDLGDFMDELVHLGSDSLDFENSIRLYCENNNVRKEVFTLITEIIN